MNTRTGKRRKRASSVLNRSTFHVCLRESDPLENSLENCRLEKLCDLKRKRGRAHSSRFENFNNSPPSPSSSHTCAHRLASSRRKRGGRGMESWRPGYPNMTRPDTTGSHPLRVEPLIYSYLVSSTQASCYSQGRIQILTILIRWPQYYRLVCWDYTISLTL